MIKLRYQKILLWSMAILNCNLLLACGSKPSTEAVVVSRQQAEHELVTFMLDYILTQEIPNNLPYIPPEERAISGPAAIVSIIIQAPPGENPKPGENPLDLTRPVRVWLQKDNQLYEAIDITETIAQYRQDQMNIQVSQAWGFYNFGIISISEDGQQAKVFWEVSCGIDCGHGYLHILERNAQGKWEITGSEWMWLA
jgi:hypothetical protein